MSFVNNSFLFSFEIECRIERSFFFYIGHCLHVSDSVHNFKIWHFFRLKRETYQMITLYVCSVECFSNVLCKQQFFCFCLKLNGRSNKVFFYSTFAIVYMFLTVSAISSVSFLNRCNGAFQATADSRQITSFKARKFSLDKVNK